MRRRTTTLLLLISCGALASAESLGRQTDDYDEIVAARVPASIPAAARNRVNPVPATRESLERGDRLFGIQCSMCHGALGDGKGELAQRYDYGIPDFTKPTYRAVRTDGELFYILENGHGKMPTASRIKEEWRWDLVHYLRSLSDRK